MLKIVNNYRGDGQATEQVVQSVSRSGEYAKIKRSLLKEHVLNVYINETLSMRMTCTPEYLPELVLGRLLTEGIIAGLDEVAIVSVCERGSEARVFLQERPGKCPDDFMEVTPSCCTDNKLLDGSALLYRDLKPVIPFAWDKEEIFQLADRFAAGMPLHTETQGTHSCFLAHEGKILFCCEDLGRHNALDKAVGYALIHSIPLTECTLYTSGRVPLDMAAKAIRAGIPIFVSKAVPTAEAVELAARCRLTLICCARSDSLQILNDVFAESGNTAELPSFCR